MTEATIPIGVEWTGETQCRGYSEALGGYVCWEHGQLRWYDPQSREYLRTLDDETDARRAENAARRAETMRADRQVALRLRAEAEVSRLRLQELGDVGECTRDGKRLRPFDGIRTRTE